MKIWTVDAFTDQPFAGNPAAVCVLTEFLPDHTMQKIAAEMNLSETAFLVKLAENHFHIRWLTPKVEVKLCGHATLSSAHILWQEGLADPGSELQLDSLSGRLIVRSIRGNNLIQLDFPTQETTKIEPPKGLFEALGLRTAIFVGQANDDVLVEVESEPEVRALAPNFSELGRVEARGVIVTAKTADRYDFVSRFFVPSQGINEDPVTGSAHCKLAPYWAKKLGKSKLTAFQASSRGGELILELVGDRVLIRGKAVTMLKGDLKWT